MVQGSTKRRLCFRCRSIDPSRGSPSRVESAAMARYSSKAVGSCSAPTFFGSDPSTRSRTATSTFLPERAYGVVCTCLISVGTFAVRTKPTGAAPLYCLVPPALTTPAPATLTRSHMRRPYSLSTEELDHDLDLQRLAADQTRTFGPLRKTEKCWAARPSPPQGHSRSQRAASSKASGRSSDAAGHHDRNLRAVYSPSVKLYVAGWP